MTTPKPIYTWAESIAVVGYVLLVVGGLLVLLGVLG